MSMRFTGSHRWLVLAWLLMLGEFAQAQSRDLLSYVDPFIGTAKSDVFTRWGNEGGTYPGAVAPWGMMQLTPETRAAGGYDHGDSMLYFFSCTHHMSGYPNGSAGQIRIMPLGTGGEGGGRPFLHREEKASPGYYKVTFSDDHSMVEVTASERVGVFRFTFPVHVIPEVFVGGMGKIIQASRRSLQGASFPVAVRYDRDVSDEVKLPDGLILRWAPSSKGPTVIILRISVSNVGMASAQRNIDVESDGLGFDVIRQRTEGLWRKELSVVGIDDMEGKMRLADARKMNTADGQGEKNKKENNRSKGNERVNAGAYEEKKKVFYTALYHSLLLPGIISDVDGKYRGRDRLIHQAAGRREYGQFSPWDTFRSLHPLLCLLFPDRQRDMLMSMMDIYRQTGHLPTDPMTGNHAIPILVDSWMKGIRGADSVLAYTAMKKSLVDEPLQSDMAIYHQRGYIPSTDPESVTRTVEYAYDDWALGQFAGLVMHRQQDEDSFMKRSYSYRNLFNPAQLFLLPRDGDQVSLYPGTTGYKEGDQWVYSFFAPQHVKDLINLMGGEGAFTARLDSALADQSIVFDNETVFQIPYLFNYAGRPDLTQYWVRTIMNRRYSPAAGGLPGNDDLGSTSSWYVLSAMGFYPVCPGRPSYDIGSPLFRKMILHLQGGRTFVIRRKDEGSGGAGKESLYVKSVECNHKKIEDLLLPHEWVMRGGEMLFAMSREPVRPAGKEGNSAEAGEPDFRIRDVAVSKREVKPHELFWVHYAVSNRGAIGTKIVKLLVNGREVGQENSLVREGEEIMDSIGCRLYPYGMAKLTIEGQEMQVEVKRTLARTHGGEQGMTGISDAGRTTGRGQSVSGADSVSEMGSGADTLEISGLVLRPLLKKNETQLITFMAQNTGGDARSFYIPVKMGDSLVGMDTLLLEPGEKRRISQELAVTGEGMRVIGVGDVRESCKIYNRDEGSVLLDLSPGAAVGDNVPDGSGFMNQGKVIRAGNSQVGLGGANGKVGKDSSLGNDKVGNGMDRLLLGKNCYIEVPNSPSLDIMGETITMMAWVYPLTGGEGLVDLFTKGDNQVLQVVDHKKLSFFAGGWGRGDCTVDLPADWLGHWHHIAGVCEGVVLRVYIDGQQQGSTRVDGRANLSGTHKWTLGRNEEFPGKRIFNGYMDRVKVFEAPLTGQEIKVIMEIDKKNIPY